MAKQNYFHLTPTAAPKPERSDVAAFGSWEWFEDPGFSIPAEIVKITGITDEMVAGQHIDDHAVDDLPSPQNIGPVAALI